MDTSKNAVAEEIRNLYQSGTRRYSSILSALKEKGLPGTLQVIAEVTRPLKPELRPRRHGNGSNSPRTHTLGRPVEAGKSIPYVVAIPKGRGIKSARVESKEEVVRMLTRLANEGLDPSRVEVFKKIQVRAKKRWEIQV